MCPVDSGCWLATMKSPESKSAKEPKLGSRPTAWVKPAPLRPGRSSRRGFQTSRRSYPGTHQNIRSTSPLSRPSSSARNPSASQSTSNQGEMRRSRGRRSGGSHAVHAKSGLAQPQCQAQTSCSAMRRKPPAAGAGAPSSSRSWQSRRACFRGRGPSSLLELGMSHTFHVASWASGAMCTWLRALSPPQRPKGGG